MILRVLISVLFLSISLFASAGDLDLTFGEATVVTPLDHDIIIVDSVIQSDNKIIIAFTDKEDVNNYNFGLIRYNENGSIDTSFGTAGKVITDLNNTDDHMTAVSFSSNGKILILGSKDGNKLAIIRYNNNGTLDTSFGSDGIIIEDDAIPSKIIHQDDGKIIALGYWGGFILLRYNSNGTPDNSFGDEGKALTPNPGYDYLWPEIITLDTDQKIIIAGTYNMGDDVAISRHNADGSIDTSFCNNGLLQNTFLDDITILNMAIEAEDEITLFLSAPYPNGFYRIVYNTIDSSNIEYGALRTPQNETMYPLKVIEQSDNKFIAVDGSSDFDIRLARVNANGDYDTSFGNNATTNTSFEPQFKLKSLAMQSDGAIICVGTNSITGNDIVLARYSVDGQRDKTFGTQKGTVTAHHYSRFNYQTTYAITQQADNKILTVGTATDTYGDSGLGDIIVLRYDAQGYADYSFGHAGKVVVKHSSNAEERADAVAIQPGRGILVGGKILQRLNPDGTLDEEEFGDNGKTAYSLFIKDIIVLTDGSILTVGNRNGDFTLARYSSDGILDTENFGVNGLIMTDINGYDYVSHAKVQVDNKLVVAGSSDNGACFSMARYFLDGTLDNSFGVEGVVITDVGSNLDKIYDLAFQSDNKIVVVGEVDNDANENRRTMALMRYNVDGSVDESFGNSGLVLDSFDNDYSGARSVEIDAAGNILVAGFGYNSGAVLFRFHSDGTKDASFNAPDASTYDAMLINTDGKIMTAGRNFSYDFSMQSFEGGIKEQLKSSFQAPLIMYLLN